LLLTPALKTVEPLRLCALAQENSWRHAVSLFGKLKYPAQFAHFDYVNPQAPKLGAVRQAAFGTYDNFNVVWPVGRRSRRRD
jgi:microcin C transport system substrate-binding protein